MNYRIKYLKYKNKYLTLQNQIGGQSEIIRKEFIITHFEKFTRSSFYIYLTNTYLKMNEIDLDLSKNTPETIDIILSELDKISEFFYDSMAPQSKCNKKILIFSYGIGCGFIEAYFALYLKHMYHKNCRLLCIENNKVDFEENLTYGVYSSIECFNKNLHDNGIINLSLVKFNVYEPQINMMVTPLYNDIYNKKIDNPNAVLMRKYMFISDLSIDIFFAFNPNGNEYDEYKKSKDEFVISHNKEIIKSKEYTDYINDFTLYERSLLNLFRLIKINEKIRTIPDFNYKYIPKVDNIPMFIFVWDNLKNYPLNSTNKQKLSDVNDFFKFDLELLKSSS
jgi:hypothetical protein